MGGLAAMILADSRFPGGGHVHSGGLEEAVARGLVTGLDDLGSFLRGRLRTAGTVAAGFAAAAAAAAAAGRAAPRSAPGHVQPDGAPGPAAAVGTAGRAAPVGATRRAAAVGTAGRAAPVGATRRAASVGIAGRAAPVGTTGRGPLIKALTALPEIVERRQRLDQRDPCGGDPGDAGDPVRTWRELDAELDARTPSPAQRAASRTQGKATMRAARQAWPSPVLDALLAAHPRPHHALLAGAVVGIDGGSPVDAARCVAYLAVTGPAAAAVRLLGLDPLAVNALVVALGRDLARVVDAAAVEGPAAVLPAVGAPTLDLLAQSHVRHHREQVRLFAS